MKKVSDQVVFIIMTTLRWTLSSELNKLQIRFGYQQKEERIS